jgi:hypothetical protein
MVTSIAAGVMPPGTGLDLVVRGVVVVVVVVVLVAADCTLHGHLHCGGSHATRYRAGFSSTRSCSRTSSSNRISSNSSSGSRSSSSSNSSIIIRANTHPWVVVLLHWLMHNVVVHVNPHFLDS